MSSEIVLFKTRETPVRWKSATPGFTLTSGIVNQIKLAVRDNPTFADNSPISETSFDITMRHIPDISRVVVNFGTFNVDPEEKDSITVNLEVPADCKRGYYRLHVVGKNSEGKPTGVYDAWVVVDKAVNPKKDNHLEVYSVRTQFADLCEFDNKLLDGLEIGVGDIAEAVERCLQQWNNTAPRTSVYNGANFPYTELLRNGVLMMLLKSINTLLSRNGLTYQGEGLAVNLEARLAQYEKLYAEYTAYWRGGMLQAKNEENVDAFNGTLSYM